MNTSNNILSNSEMLDIIGLVHKLENIESYMETIDTNYGICMNILNKYSYNHIIPKEWIKFIESWEHFSGNKGFPIHLGHKKEAKNLYRDIDNLWIGEYGEMRIKCCKDFAKYLKGKYMQKKRIVYLHEVTIIGTLCRVVEEGAAGALYGGQILLRVYNGLISLTDPKHTWIGIKQSSMKVEILPEDYSICVHQTKLGD